MSFCNRSRADETWSLKMSIIHNQNWQTIIYQVDEPADGLDPSKQFAHHRGHIYCRLRRLEHCPTSTSWSAYTCNAQFIVWLELSGWSRYPISFAYTHATGSITGDDLKKAVIFYLFVYLFINQCTWTCTLHASKVDYKSGHLPLVKAMYYIWIQQF